MIPRKEYLQQLLENTKQLYDSFEYPNLDLSLAKITYIPTKKRNYLGIRAGIDGLSEMKRYNVREVDSIRKNCMFYNKYYKVDEKVLQIDCFVAGHDRLACTYVAYYENNCRYLFPFHNQTKDIGAYILVTRFENDRVVEEYFVRNGQIVYESYEYSDNNIVKNYAINYVPLGKYPVITESKGYYLLDTLEYVQEEQYVGY